MATTVDTLLVRIEADMSDLRRTLRRVEQQTEQSQRKIENTRTSKTLPPTERVRNVLFRAFLFRASSEEEEVTRLTL